VFESLQLLIFHCHWPKLLLLRTHVTLVKRWVLRISVVEHTMLLFIPLVEAILFLTDTTQARGCCSLASWCARSMVCANLRVAERAHDHVIIISKFTWCINSFLNVHILALKFLYFSFKAKIWTFRKELIHQVNLEIIITWSWALSATRKLAHTMDLAHQEAKEQHPRAWVVSVRKSIASTKGMNSSMVCSTTLMRRTHRFTKVTWVLNSNNLGQWQWKINNWKDQTQLQINMLTVTWAVDKKSKQIPSNLT
jgi:hypothetical protein